MKNNAFDSDYFSATTLTDALEFVPYVPRRLGALGLFMPNPIRTTQFNVEQMDSQLRIIPASQRGQEPDEKPRNPERVMRQIVSTRLAEGDTIYSSEVQDIVRFGSDAELKELQMEIMRRIGTAEGNEGLRADMEITREHHRMGAIQGNVLDADGVTPLYNWFTIMNVVPIAQFNFNWGATNTDTGQIRVVCNKVQRAMHRAAKGAWFGNTRIHALCGDNFYDALTSNAETHTAYQQQGSLRDLTTGGGMNAWEFFDYGRIRFENYRSTDDETSIAIDTDSCRFFPVGNGIFKEVLAPGEGRRYVNRLGRREYMLRITDLLRDMWDRFELYSYPTFMCTRPRMLLEGRTQP